MPRKGPQGLHFFDRKTGFNLLLDEVKPPQTEWSLAPRTLSVALSNVCDCMCPHCFAPKNDASLNLTHVYEWAVELDAYGGHSIGFGGGEPTIVPGLAGLCSKICDTTGLAVTITTHGLRFDGQLADALNGSVHFIRISIGGLGETYEKTFGLSFETLTCNLPNIRSVAPIGFNLLLTPETVVELDKTVDFACSNGASEILLLPCVRGDGSLALDQEQLSQLSEWLAENADRYPLAVSAHASASLTVPELPVGDPRGETYDFLHLDAAGTLRRSAFQEAGVAVGPDGFMAAVSHLRSGLEREPGEVA